MFSGGWHIISGGGGGTWAGLTCSVGGSGTSVGSGFDFGPNLVDDQWGGGGIHVGAGVKVLLLVKPWELQFYFAPLSKAAK